MLLVQLFNHSVIPVPKPALSTSIKLNITIFQLVVSTSLDTIPTPKSKKLKIYLLLKLLSNAQHHLLEQFVLNCLIPNPSTTISSMIPKKSILILAQHTQIRLTTPQILAKLNPQIKVPEAIDAEKDVVKKDPSTRLQFPHHNLGNNATIANARPIHLIGVNPILKANRRRIRRVPAVKFADHSDSEISSLYFYLF